MPVNVSVSKSLDHFRRTCIGLAMLVGMVFLICFHLRADSPLCTGGNPPADQVAAEKISAALLVEMQKASQGRNLELQFKLPPDLWSHATFYLTMYYRAAYEFFPRRVYIGLDDHVIHWTVHLKDANQLPPSDWLKAHDVAAIFWFLPGNQDGPGIWVEHLP